MTGAPIYLVSACSTGEEFVAAFRRYVDKTGVFVPIGEPFAAGRRCRVAVTLHDGGVMIEGEAEVMSSARTPSILHGRVGMTLRFSAPDAASKTMLAELEKARLAMRPAPPSVAPRPATLPAAPRPVPPSPQGRIDAVNALAECVAIGDPEALSALATPAAAPVPPRAGPRFVVPAVPTLRPRAPTPAAPLPTTDVARRPPAPAIPLGPSSDTFVAASPEPPAIDDAAAGPASDTFIAAVPPDSAFAALATPTSVAAVAPPPALAAAPATSPDPAADPEHAPARSPSIEPGAAPRPVPFAATTDPGIFANHVAPSTAAASTSASGGSAGRSQARSPSAEPDAATGRAPTPSAATIEPGAARRPPPSPFSETTEPGIIAKPAAAAPPGTRTPTPAPIAPGTTPRLRTQTPRETPVAEPRSAAPRRASEIPVAVPRTPTRPGAATPPPPATRGPFLAAVTELDAGAQAAAAAQRSEPGAASPADPPEPAARPSSDAAIVVATLVQDDVSSRTQVHAGAPRPGSSAMARGSTPAQPLPVASAVRSIAAIDPSLDPPFDDVEIEVDIAEPTDLVNLLDLAIAGTSGAEPPPRKTVLGVAVPAAASPAASEPAPRAADETTGRDRVVAMVIDPALEAMTPTEMGRPPIPSPATASSPRPFASATRSANPSAANPMGSGARAPSGVVSTFARITPAAPGAALPSGDWTIALDPGAPDGWTAPVPTVGSRAATGAEHLPPASRGDALPPPEPKVQVDPTLIEPLHGALSEELMRSASEPPRPIGYAATGAADARGDAGPGPAAAQGPGATGYASAAGYAGAMGGAPGGSSAGGTGYPGAGAPSFGGAAADAIGAGAAGYADAGGTREPEAGAAGYAVAMGYADAANASYAAAAGGYPVAAAVGYAGAGAGGYANAGAGGHASPGAAVPVAIDPSPQSQPQSHPSAQPQPPSQPSIPSHSTVHPSLHPGFQPSQSLPPFPPLQASLPTPLPTDSFPPPYRSPMHPTEAPAYALDPSYQMVPAGVPSPGSVADGSFAVPRHSATMLSARGRRRRLVIVIASAALVIAIGVVALAMLSGKPDDAPRGNRAPRVPTSVVPRPTQTTLGSATAAPGSAPTPESAPAMRDDHTAGAPSAASAPATGATTPTGGCFADVSSTPSGAEIVVDDAVLGTTPQAVPLPCGAPVDLEIRKAHLVAVTRTVTPAPGHVKVRVALTKQLALIKVSSAPEGATVTLNGRSLGVTPTTVKVPALESSTLTITKPGYETQTERVSPRSSGTSVRVQLRRPEH